MSLTEPMSCGQNKPVSCARDRLFISYYSALKIAVTTYCTWLNHCEDMAKKSIRQASQRKAIDSLHQFLCFR